MNDEGPAILRFPAQVPGIPHSDFGKALVARSPRHPQFQLTALCSLNFRAMLSALRMEGFADSDSMVIDTRQLGQASVLPALILLDNSRKVLLQAAQVIESRSFMFSPSRPIMARERLPGYDGTLGPPLDLKCTTEQSEADRGVRGARAGCGRRAANVGDSPFHSLCPFFNENRPLFIES